MTKHRLVIGIDEAGRGPLIGDMVVTGVAVSSSVIGRLEQLGVRDSKALSPGARSKARAAVLGEVPVSFVSIYVHAAEIDSKNLNTATLEAAKTVLLLIRELAWRGGEVEIYVDEIKGGESKLRRFSTELYGDKLAVFVMEPEADSKYPVVSLASIIAKTLRDESIQPGRVLFGDFGSGYSADPKTVKWVTEYSKLSPPPLIVRRKWRNLERLAPSWWKKSARSLLDYIKRGET